jgi:hypothetical protein
MVKLMKLATSLMLSSFLLLLLLSLVLVYTTNDNLGIASSKNKDKQQPSDQKPSDQQPSDQPTDQPTDQQPSDQQQPSDKQQQQKTSDQQQKPELAFQMEPQKEICNDGVDNDGDGKIDGQDPDCQQKQQAGSVPPNTEPDAHCLEVFGRQQVTAGIPTPPECINPQNKAPSTDAQNQPQQQQQLAQPSSTGTESTTDTKGPLTTFGQQPLGAPIGTTGGGNTGPSGTTGTEQPSTSTDKQQKQGNNGGGGANTGDIIDRLPPTETKVFKQPDGTVIYKDPDGTVRTEYTNGDSRITYGKEGLGNIGIEYVHQNPGVSQFIQFKDGSTRKWIFGEPKKAQIIDTLRDGTSITQHYDKTVTKKPDGTTITDSGGQTVTKKPDGTTITDSGGHWHIKFPPRPDGTIKTYYEDGTTVIEKGGKIIKRFTE